MITFLKLKADGFCSIDTLELPLNYNGTVLIKAPNGFGKSSIFSALVWGLYGKNLKGVSEVTTWEKIRPKNYKGVKVEVYFQNNDKLFRIIRCQEYNDVLEDGAKGKNRLLLYEDSIQVDTKGKVKIQDDIEKAIGLSYNLFMNSIMFGQGLKRLIQESNPDKKKIFEEVFDLTFINEARAIAQDKKADIQSEARDLEQEDYHLRTQLGNVQEAYEDIIHQEEDEEREYLEAKKKLKALKKSVLEDIKKLNYDPDRLAKVKEENLQLVKSQHKVENSLCMPMEELINKLYSYIIKNNTKKALDLVTELKGAYDKLHSINTKLDQVTKELHALQLKRVSYEEYNKKLKGINEDLDTCKNGLKELHSKDSSKLSAKYKVKIEDIQKSIEDIDLQLSSRRKAITDYQWVIDDPLGNNGIKAYLFDSSLNRVNEALNSYTDLLGFRIGFLMDLDSARKDFVTVIEKDDCCIEYDELSGGEKQLCNIAMAFAMNEVLTSSRGISLAFLDEVFESLSQDNIEVVVSLIRSVFKDKTLFLITHHDSLPLSNSKVLQVHKVNGLSSYEVL